MSIAAPTEDVTVEDSQINSGIQASLVMLMKSVEDECSKQPEAVVFSLGLPIAGLSIPSK